MSTELPISVSTRRMAPVTATAGQTLFAFTFPLIRAEDIRVLRTRSGVQTELAIGPDFSVSGVGQAAGGQVTLTAGSLAGDVIVIEGDAGLDRLTGVTLAGRFSSALIDQEFDLSLIRDQELRRDVDGIAAAFGGNLQETVEDLNGASVVAGIGASVSNDDETGKTTVSAIGLPGGGSGNVVGPASSVNNRIALFSGTTGRVLQDGGQTISGLQTAIDGKAALVHSHVIADTTGLQTALDGKIGIPGSSAQGDILYRSATSWTRLAAGTSGQVLQTNGAGADPSWASSASSASITLGTAVDSTSGSAIDFTGVPAGVKRVTVGFRRVSINGSSGIIVRLGTSGGFVSSGYLGECTYIASGNLTGALTSTAGFPVFVNTTSDLISGSMVLNLIGSNTWVASVSGRRLTSSAIVGGGDVALSDVLAQIRVTTINGTDVFDNGTINIAWEF